MKLMAVVILALFALANVDDAFARTCNSRSSIKCSTAPKAGHTHAPKAKKIKKIQKTREP
jgi:hypothetical protein